MRLAYIAFWLVLMAYVGLLIRLQFPPTIEPRPIIDTSERNCQRLRHQMSEAEVEAVIGGPAGDYRTRSDISYVPPRNLISGGGISLPQPGRVTKEWRTDEAMVIVEFEPGFGATSIRQRRGIGGPSWSDILRDRMRDLALVGPNGP